MKRDTFRGCDILITGGLGFIGSNLARSLAAEGARVTVLDALIPGHGGNPDNLSGCDHRLTIVKADQSAIADLLPSLKYFHTIFNLAGQVSHVDSMTNPLLDLHCNCAVHLALLEACKERAFRGKIIFTSTRQVYGDTGGKTVDEDFSVNPVDNNGINKLAAEQYHLLYQKLYGLRTVILRLCNIYGPRQLIAHNRQGFIPWFVRLALTGNDIPLFGGGTDLREALFVSDIIAALKSAALAPLADGGRVYNIGNDYRISIRDLAEMIINAAGSGRIVEAPFPQERAAIRLKDCRLDFARARRELGWQPSVSLLEGIRQTIIFYRRNPNRYIDEHDTEVITPE
ncbi:MAG: NAD-dependent epimerase/dehydratase family protein [bacterium]|jgi:UDP-glucose 4-epimerase|nr:NAD-dependent epimerase/dehydratase family protein [bacterium]